jgi:hypothetical protein
MDNRINQILRGFAEAPYAFSTQGIIFIFPIVLAFLA